MVEHWEIFIIEKPCEKGIIIKKIQLPFVKHMK
jgi:hypothetical protein